MSSLEFFTYLQVFILEVVSRKILYEKIVEFLRQKADTRTPRYATFMRCLENADGKSKFTIHFFAMHLKIELAKFCDLHFLQHAWLTRFLCIRCSHSHVICDLLRSKLEH